MQRANGAAVWPTSDRGSPQRPDQSVEAARAATYPAPFPEGWYVVARSKDLGQRPLFVRCAGHNWAVFRDENGHPCAVDAYCPHLGANLADGCVDNGMLKCPFHGWRISGSGHVVGLSGRRNADPRYRARSWAADEIHGWVVVFHRHTIEGPGPAPTPPYRLERVTGIDTGQFLYRGEYDAGRVRMHLSEFAENSADFGHFEPLHGRLRIPWTQVPVPGMSIRHEASWRRDEQEQHVSWFGDQATLQFRGRPIKDSGARAKVRFDGPGGVIRFEFSLDRGGGRVVMFQSHTPVEPLMQHIRFQWFSERKVPRMIASFVVGNWISQWRQDIRIWERKIYRSQPLVSREDGPIHQLRRWYAQFYRST